MFRNLRLSTKLLITFVPIFIIAIAVSGDVNIAFQEDLIQKQALQSAGQKAQIVREALVNQMVENQQVKDEFLDRIQHVAGLNNLYIRMTPGNLHLREFLEDSTRTARLMKRVEFANSKDEIDVQYGNEVLATGEQKWLRTGDNFRAMVPFKAEKKCLSCHEVPLGQTLGVAHIEFPLSDVLSSIKESSVRSGMISVGFSFFSIILGFVFYRTLIQKPIRKLEAAADEIGKGNLSYEMEVSEAKDELGNLSRTFNQMKNALRQSQEAVRMSTVGQVASSLIHDFRSPMKEVLSAIDQIQRGQLNEEKKMHACESARAAVQLVNKMTQDLFDYTTGELKVDKKLTDVPQLLRAISSEAKPDLDRENIAFETSAGYDGTIILDPDRTRRALVNIISYAQNYVAKGGKIRLSSEIIGNELLMKITDNGSGIPDAFKEKIFEPFVKIVKGKGVGIEMALAKRMIEKQGGRIQIASKEGKGSTYSIVMPMAG